MARTKHFSDYRLVALCIRAKIFSDEIYTICPFLRKHSNALISANDIYSFTNIAVEREIWQKLKKLIICAAKADKTYFM